MSRRILMVIAPEKFRDEEYAQPREIFDKAGIEVTVVSSRRGKAKGTYGLEVSVDKLLSEVHASDFDAVVFIGGTGSRVYVGDPEANRLIREAETSKRLIGAICAAPGTLAATGILKGKKATSYIEERELLLKGGAIFTGNLVEVDGRLVTGNGPQAATAFGEKIAEMLKK